MAAFTVASLMPLPLLLLAAYYGGPYTWVALLYLTVFTAVMDKLLPRNWRNRNPQAEFPAAHGLSQVLGLAHLWMMVAAIYWIGGGTGANGIDAVVAAVAFGIWFGQVGHPNAHELIHRPEREARQLGRLVYITLLFGHHASAHPKVHHKYVATPLDPNTARPGESFWRYVPRAWFGSFRAGYAAERADLRRAGRSGLANPYIGYVLGAAGMVLLAWALAGVMGIVALLWMAGLAQSQILLSDYVQHYGLEREPRGDGRYEPVGPQHSWNSPHAMTGAMMLNAPRHSDHHVHPMRAYPALQLDRATMPVMPYALPIMASLALVPRLWRRVMDHRLSRWAEEDDHDYMDFLGDTAAE
ncbi:alkane 1-monooxygenase [Pseudooceanicola sp.]|uniref:alkane 1-monooxygenase n=1 Tax=Pseudooceanicola sp. TaxID=1914328 RepID=UPI004059C3AC